MRKLFALMTLCVAVTACATAPSPELLAQLDSVGQTRQPAAVSVGAFKVVDSRIADAAVTRVENIGWAGGFSCVVGILQLGHNEVATDRIARLENALAAAFPDKAQGTELIVRRFDIYINRGAEVDAVSWGAAMGSVGIFGVGGIDTKAEKIWRSPKCSQDKMSGGWFNSADLTNNRPPITVDLAVTVFGKPYTINAAQSHDLDAEALAAAVAIKSPALDAIAQPAIDKVVNRLIERVKTSP